MHSLQNLRLFRFELIGLALLLNPLAPTAASENLNQAGQLRPSSTTQNAANADQIATDLRQAVELLQSGKLDEAESILRRILVITPRNSDAHNFLGIILDQHGKTIEAERQYRAAIRLNPKGVSAIANLGVLLARTNRADEAIATFESVLRMAPDHPQATLNIGLQYSVRGDDPRAIPLLERAIVLGLDSYAVRYRLGISLYNLQRFAEARQAFEAALALSPKADGPYYYLGLIAWTAGHDEQAAGLWERAVNLPEANFMLGEALRKNQRTRAAIEFYQRALAQDATKFVYYARLGGAYLAVGEPNQALEIFRRGLQRFPNLPQAHYFVGIVARAQANYDLAEAEFRKSLSLDAGNVNTLAQLGFVLIERDRITEGEALLRRSLTLDDRHFYANYDLGRLLVKSRRYEEALPVLQHAAALKPKNPGVHYQLFMALSRLKRKEEADRALVTFKQLEEERKAHPQQEDEGELENSGSPSSTRPHAP